MPSIWFLCSQSQNIYSNDLLLSILPQREKKKKKHKSFLLPIYSLLNIDLYFFKYFIFHKGEKVGIGFWMAQKETVEYKAHMP